MVSENGIYEITQPELVSAGMDVSKLDRTKLQMMTNGSAISFVFIGDDDDVFEPDEAIRFYGWKFDRSRKDTWFVEDNVFWLWEGDGNYHIEKSIYSPSHPEVTQLPHTATFEENHFPHRLPILSYSDFVNGYDFWYWDEFTSSQSTIQSVELPNPAPAGTVDIKAEIFYRYTTPAPMEIKLNGINLGQSLGAENYNSFYYSASTPTSTLTSGNNRFEFIGGTTIAGEFSRFYLNQFEVTYMRDLIAVNDELAFVTENDGLFNYLIDGWSTANPDEIIAWDISDRHRPEKQIIDSTDLTSGNPNLLRLAYLGNGGETIHITTINQLKTVDSIVTYTATDQTPFNGAEWLSIAHPSFVAEANRLANHRAATNGISTHVADWEEIKNQYGFGFGTPSAIQSYLAEALANWPIPPKYLVIAGNSTLNPAQRPCVDHCANVDWSTEPTFVPTDIQRIDRFAGVISSDYPYMTLSDEVNPILVMTSRLPASSVTELSTMIDKVIMYDSAVQNNAPWLNSHLFLAGKFDGSTYFCGYAEDVADYLPSSASTTLYCDDGSNNVMPDFIAEMNTNSAGFVHYFGRSVISGWRIGGNNTSVDTLPDLDNQGKPAIIFSAASQDGGFAEPQSLSFDRVSMAENMMVRNDGRGAAAYLGNTGISYTLEGRMMQWYFFDAYRQESVLTIGDATQSALDMLGSNDFPESVLFMHHLFGDAGMLIKPNPNVPTSVTLQNTETAGQATYPVIVLVTAILLISTFRILPQLLRTPQCPRKSTP